MKKLSHIQRLGLIKRAYPIPPGALDPIPNDGMMDNSDRPTNYPGTMAGERARDIHNNMSTGDRVSASDRTWLEAQGSNMPAPPLPPSAGGAGLILNDYLYHPSEPPFARPSHINRNYPQNNTMSGADAPNASNWYQQNYQTPASTESHEQTHLNQSSPPPLREVVTPPNDPGSPSRPYTPPKSVPSSGDDAGTPEYSNSIPPPKVATILESLTRLISGQREANKESPGQNKDVLAQQEQQRNLLRERMTEKETDTPKEEAKVEPKTESKVKAGSMIGAGAGLAGGAGLGLLLNYLARTHDDIRDPEETGYSLKPKSQWSLPMALAGIGLLGGSKLGPPDLTQITPEQARALIATQQA
jgi:hypothetical protein